MGVVDPMALVATHQAHLLELTPTVFKLQSQYLCNWRDGGSTDGGAGGPGAGASATATASSSVIVGNISAVSQANGGAAGIDYLLVPGQRWWQCGREFHCYEYRNWWQRQCNRRCIWWQWWSGNRRNLAGLGPAGSAEQPLTRPRPMAV